MMMSCMVVANVSSAWADSTTTTWNFGSDSEYLDTTTGITLEGKGTATYTEIGGLIFDVTNGKVSSKRSDWLQVNTGTIVYIPSTTKYSKINIVHYNNANFKLNNEVCESGANYTCLGTKYAADYLGSSVTFDTSKYYVKYENTDGGYIGSITSTTVDYKDVSISGTISSGVTSVTFTSSEEGIVNATVTDGSYTTTLKNGATYSVSVNDGYVITDGSTITVDESSQTFNITAVDSSTKYTVSGKITGVDINDVTSIKIGDTEADINTTTATYTAEVIPSTYSVTANSIDGYTLSSLSSASLTVSGDTTRNIHYKKNTVAATSTTVYVDGSNKGANHYDTITQAIAGLKAGNKTSGATIVLTSGETYQEQVIVDVPNLKFETSGSDTATVQWYYGIGYTYYSANPSTGFYDEEYAYDKSTLSPVQRWGCSVRVTANGFEAENIVFKNTFNYEVTDAEIADGVTANTGAYSDTSITLNRTSGLDVTTKDATERAAAIVIDGNNSAFENCQFLSSQDTVYSNGNVYMRNCFITGQTDYLFNGGGTVIIDNSELQWKGYDKAVAGYITAAKGKYIFRNCSITNSNLTTTPGYYGRPWETDGNVTCTVSFIGCQTNGNILSSGYAKWKSTSAALSTVNFIESNNKTTGNVAFYTTLHTSAFGENERTDLGNIADPKEDYEYFGENWLPFNHDAYNIETIDYKTTANWDFQNANPSSITITNIQGNSNTGTVASDVEGVDLDVDATVSNGKLQYNSAGYAQFNNGTIIHVPVYYEKDLVTVVSYPGQFKYTIGGIAANDNTTTYKASTTDVTNGYVEIIATDGAYLYSIQLQTQKEFATTTTATWDFVNTRLTASPINSKTAILPSDNDNVKLYVNALNGNVRDNSNSYQLSAGTMLNIPVFSVGDNVTVNGFSGYEKGLTINGTNINESTHILSYSVTSADLENGFVTLTVTTGNAPYVCSIELATTGDVTQTAALSNKQYITLDNDLYIIGEVDSSSVDDISTVGYGIAKSEATAFTSQTVNSTEVYGTITYIDSNDEEQTITPSEGKLLVAFKVEGAANNTDAVYISPYSISDTYVKPVHSDAVSVSDIAH